MELVLAAVYSYLLGAVPSAYVIGRIKGKDVTSEGSGNIGGTNAYRVLGARLGILVALMDVGKVLLALYVTKTWLGTDLALALSALAAVVGHNWSVYVGFKGGKGIAVSIGTYLFLFPGLALLALMEALFNVLVTKYVSLGSLNFVLAMALLLLTRPGLDLSFQVLAVVLFLIALWRHRGNVARLRAGKERRFGES